jgi:hypothetical protein
LQREAVVPNSDVTSADAALFWAAARLEPDMDAVVAAVRDGADLSEVSGAAIQHRCSALLWGALDDAGLLDPGAPWYPELRRDVKCCQAQAEIVFPRVGDAVFTPLKKAGLELLTLKGAALFDRYPRPGLRPMDDIDLLAPGPLFRHALEVVTAAGWSIRREATLRWHEAILVHPGLPGLSLEIHRDLASWARRSTRLRGRDLWDRRVPISIAGSPAFGLGPEDELLLICTHMSKPFHVLRRMIWVVDLAVVVEAAERAGRPVNWDRLGSLATATKSRTALAAGLTLATRIGVDSPAELRRMTASRARRAAVEAAFDYTWPLDTPSTRTLHRLGYALVDDWRLRSALFVDELTEPNWRGAPGRGVRDLFRAARSWRELRQN